MLKDWESVINKYNSMNPTSKSHLYLDDWGDILSAAYMLNSEKANRLWQELIELNVSKDEKYAKYYVAQIFNSIIDHLDSDDAIAFLVMNEQRLAWFVRYRCNYQDDILNAILSFYIKYEKFQKTATFFSLVNSSSNQGSAFPDSPVVASLIATVTSCILKIFDGEVRGKQLVKAKKDSLVNYLIWQKDIYPHALVSYVSDAYLVVANLEKSYSPNKIKNILINLIKGRQNTVFWALIYHQRNILSDDDICEILVRYTMSSEDYHLLKDSDDTMSQYSKDKWDWLTNFVKNHPALAVINFSKTEGHLIDAETKFLTDLIECGAVHLFVLLYSEYYLKKGSEEYHSFDDYISRAIDNVTDASYKIAGKRYDYRITYGNTEISPQEYYGDMYRLSQLDIAGCTAFAFAINYMANRLYNKNGSLYYHVTRRAKEIVNTVGMGVEILHDEDLLESINIDNLKRNLEDTLGEITRKIDEADKREEKERLKLQEQYSATFDYKTVNEQNIDLLWKKIKYISKGFETFYQEAEVIKKLEWDGKPISSCPIVATNQATYGMLNQAQLAYYLYFRTRVYAKAPVVTTVYQEPYVCILGTELLLSLCGYSEDEALSQFDWLIDQYKNITTINLILTRFKTDYQALHHIKKDNSEVDTANMHPWERNVAHRTAVAGGNNRYLSAVVEANIKYRLNKSTFIDKANYSAQIRGILNEILVRFKDRLATEGVDFVKYIIGSPWGEVQLNHSMSKFMSPAICSLEIIKNVIGYKPEPNDIASSYSTSVYKQVCYYDRKTSALVEKGMHIPCVDEEFCEYAVRQVEQTVRNLAGYQFSLSPTVPSLDEETIYVYDNYSYNHKTPLHQKYHNSLIREYRDAYELFDIVAADYVNEYYSIHSDELQMLRSVHAAQTFEAKKTYVEKVADMVASAKDYDNLMGNILDLYKNAKPTTQRTKGAATFNLLWNLWMLHGTKSSAIQPCDILAEFKDKEAELVGKKALLSGNFEQALPWLKSHYNYSVSTATDTQLLDDCLVISCYALDTALAYYNINFASLLLGEEKAAPWDLITKFNGVALTPTASRKDISGVEFYEGLPTPTAYSYQPSELNRAFTRYLIKNVEQRYFDVKKIVKNPPRKEVIQGIFGESKHDEMVSLIDSIIYNIAIYTINRRTPKQIEHFPFVVEVGFNCRLEKPKTQQQLFLLQDVATDVALNTFCTYYGVDKEEVKTDEPPCEGITFNPSSSTYKDFIEDSFVTEAPFVQITPKMVLTRFYQLYDSYYEQLDELFSRNTTYDSKFAIFSTKLMKKGDGFVGKDLYQFAMLKDVKEEGEDFLQWIEHIKHGELTFPNFQAYVVLWYYYVLNGKLFADKKDLGLALMCKVWNHYLPSFSDQDANLLLGWIKDYWMIYCPSIPLEEFKRLFNRKIVFANEYSVNSIYKNGLLAYYNDICYYRVLSGKLVESGHRDIFEKAMRKVNVQIEMLFRRYDVSFKKALALAAGKNQYLFLRAIVDPVQLQKICDSFNENRISDYEAYRLSYNSSSKRYQWIFSTGEYDIEFLRLFFEYLVKATEKELRTWLKIGIPKTFNVDIDAIYHSDRMPNTLAKLFAIDSQTNEIDQIIKQCVEAVCIENNIEHPGVKIKSFAAERAEKRGKYKTSIDYSVDFGGIDLAGSVSETSLEEARRVLRGNQGKLVIEDETAETVSVVDESVTFSSVEIEVLKILLFSNNVISSFNDLQARNIIPSVVITQINEKAADLYGDLLIDEDTTPPSVIEENREICLEVISDYE